MSLQVEIPPLPLTAAQYTQLKVDVRTSIDENASQYPDNTQLWALCNALYYLLENPTPPPPEE